MRREGRIVSSQYESVKTAFIEDIEDMSVCGITKAVIEKTVAFLETMPLKTLDALHVAGAVEWSADVFVSADGRQLKAAASAGLRPMPV